MATDNLDRRQATGAQTLSEFNFVITYRSGKKIEKIDALIRMTDDRSEMTSMNVRNSRFRPCFHQSA